MHLHKILFRISTASFTYVKDSCKMIFLFDVEGAEKVKEVKDKAKFKSICEASGFTLADSTVNDKSPLSDSLKNSVSESHL